MISQDRLCFVQFPHPGPEHRPGKGLFKDWNRGPHKRKFLQNRGRCKCRGATFEGDLLFWGEWEPQSIADLIAKPSRFGPRYIFKPFYKPPESYAELQNTDPFVFGQCFYYTCCKQNKEGRPVQLRHLAKGSVILFGSCLADHFCLDTVFVVNDWIDHDESNFRDTLSGKVPRGYGEVTLATIYPEAEKTAGRCGPSQPRPLGRLRRDEKKSGKSSCPPRPSASFRLYRGATAKKPVGEMFSFFPCLRAEPGLRGFERPIIRIRDLITDKLKMGFRLNEQTDISRVKELWDSVVEQVESKTLCLGIHTDMPERRTGPS